MSARSQSDALGLRRDLVCLICAGEAARVGRAASMRGAVTYDMASCPDCGFAFIVEPRTDFENLYDDDYYRGAGFDPSVDYAAEQDERTVRVHEWAGVLAVVRSLHARPIRTWLDYGCGYGGLVSYLRRNGVDAVGHDIGHPADHARSVGVSFVSESDLPGHNGRYDVITAIEVLEHAIDPIELLESFRDLLAPDGLVFVTTGNAERHRRALTEWRYVAPEVHVSYFEPRTLRRAYQSVGLEPVDVGHRRGMQQIMQYKILKALGRHRREAWHRVIPWSLVSRLADRREGVSAQPAARQPR
ncbi:MAG: class I SAM-dependent methyltransferase [Acidimicrobiales bacterium]